MPYLQLDLPERYAADTKRRLATRLVALYAETMQTRPEMVNVGFRELGPSNLYRLIGGDLLPVIVLHCDVRRGRPAERRLALADALVTACAEALGLPPERFSVEFTQHAADEMYRDGAWGREWSPDEAAR